MKNFTKFFSVMIWAESVVGQKVENKIYILVSSHHIGHFFLSGLPMSISLDEIWDL